MRACVELGLGQDCGGRSGPDGKRPIIYPTHSSRPLMGLNRSQAGDPGALSASGCMRLATRSPNLPEVPAEDGARLVEAPGVVPDDLGLTRVARGIQRLSATAILARQEAASPQTLPETPSSVVPTTIPELLVSRKASGGVGSRLKAREPPSSPAIAILARGVAVPPQTLPETPSLVVPTADQELLVFGKASSKVGSHLKDRETPPSPAIMSMVSRVAEMYQITPERTSPAIEGKDVVPWSPGALDGLHSVWGFVNPVVDEVQEDGQTVGKEDRVVETQEEVQGVKDF
ncbi:hypothetical protein FH972_026899 [Carpinus fangiana]|uniref:Uncharacterized protein n=1 Tax=Carpinus fangiana TaxID=176857 RepID=A0A5N6L5E2_9ROSI|nr:hypothetical protein FH972_026899 [Carpinus fangiana]